MNNVSCRHSNYTLKKGRDTFQHRYMSFSIIIISVMLLNSAFTLD